MKVDSVGKPLLGTLELQQKSSPAHDSPSTVHQAVKPGNEAFNVQLSTAAGQTNESAASDEVTLEKIAAIRDRLAAGTYSISGKDVANKILRSLKG